MLRERVIPTLLWIAVLVAMLCSVSKAHAGAFSVKCTYSHTLPDDSIVHYGQPGVTMVHEFFGNTKTDAYSTSDTLLTNKVTTCDQAADISAYWVPQLKRAAGIVTPDFAKTYYKNDQPVVPLSAIPAGLEMLAGDHMSTGPKPQINYLCRGSNYTTIAPTNCPVVTDSKGTYSQLDISIHFPDCWDGVTLRPSAPTFKNNMTYRNSDGTCPAAFPVKIPELQVNVQYSLGQNPDLSTAQLSMDPMMMNGTLTPEWGSLYTAHADFINGWKADVMQSYAINNCANNTRDCGDGIPTYYPAASANVALTSTGLYTAAGPSLQLAPGDTVFVKVPVPSNLSDYPWTKVYFQVQGKNVTDANTLSIAIYSATTTWNETDRLPHAADCSSTKAGSMTFNANDTASQGGDVTNSAKSVIAAGGAEIGLCLKNTTADTVVMHSREATVFPPALYIR
jgi:hypothetical protein